MNELLGMPVGARRDASRGGRANDVVHRLDEPRVVIFVGNTHRDREIVRTDEYHVDPADVENLFQIFDRGDAFDADKENDVAIALFEVSLGGFAGKFAGLASVDLGRSLEWAKAGGA